MVQDTPPAINARVRGRVVSRLAIRFKGELATTLLRTFTARGIAALGSFVLVAVLGRLYGPAGVGVFALAQSLLMAIAIFSRYGMDNAFMRFVGRDVHSPQVYAYLRYACIKALLLSVIGGVALFFSRGLWAHVFDTPELAAVLVGIAIAAPAFTLSCIFSGFMKAIRKPATGLLLQNGAIALITAGLVLCLQLFVLPGADLVNIGIAYAIAAWVLAAIAVSLCWFWFRCRYRGEARCMEAAQLREFNRSSSAFFANNLASFMISVVAFWIAGYFLIASDVGLFKAAQQLAALIAVFMMVINAIYPPRFAVLFYESDWARLNKLARQSAALGGGLAIVPAAVCLLAPGWVLGLVGVGFSQAVIPLYILVVAQFINVGCGPVGYLLNMTGHEPLVRNIAWAASTLGVVAILVLTPVWGVPGAALGVAGVTVLRKLAGVYFAWRRLGVWILPLPNMLRLMGVPHNIPIVPSKQLGRSDTANLTRDAEADNGASQV